MAPLRPPRVWILTDGKAGDEQPLIGLAEAMGCEPELRRVAPRPFFALAMPWGPIDPKDRPAKAGSPLAPPYPDICLATGRRAVAYLRAVKSASPETFTVFFKDPRTRRHGADLLVIQQHDDSRHAQAMVITTAPNRITQEALAAIRAAPPTDLAALPHPRMAALVGGNSRHHHYRASDIAALVNGLRERLEAGASLMITTSRRTPDALAAALREIAGHEHARLWDGNGKNPLLDYLALADTIVVTADSTNMIGEAAATGRPVQIFYPTGGHSKTERLIRRLAAEATIGTFPDAEALGDYPPVNVTGLVARTILERWQATSTRL